MKRLSSSLSEISVGWGGGEGGCREEVGQCGDIFLFSRWRVYDGQSSIHCGSEDY